MRDTERVDHGDAIKRHAHRVRSLADALTERAEPMTIAALGNIEDATTATEHHADALAAERDALRNAVTLALFYLGGEEADEVRAALGKYDPT